MNHSANEAHDTWVFPRIWAAILLGLIGVSYRLWIPHDEFPAVALLDIVTGLPDSIDLILTTALIIAATVVVLSSANRPRLWWVLAALLSCLFVLDQHRLQPWAYQTAIYAVAFATLKPMIARRWIIPLAASIYIYSALGKFDYQFVHTVGIDFLETVFTPIGGLADKLEFSTRAKLAHLFPVAELISGVLLLPRVTRRFAGVAVVILHACLIVMLGPWGLNHSGGVLLWNVGLMVQAWFLFVRATDQTEEKLFQLPMRNDHQRDLLGLTACIAVLLAIVMPVFERTGYWDHWLSWALYSPHNSRVDIQIHQSGISLLPSSVREFVVDDIDGDGWRDLALDRWSLARRSVPIYPQARYQLAVSVALAQHVSLDDQIRGRIRGVSDRRTGKRMERQLLNMQEMQQALADYWLVPRSDESKD